MKNPLRIFVVLLLTQGCDRYASVSGYIVDEQSLSAIPDVTITFRCENKSATILSDTEGFFKISEITGLKMCDCIISKDGYFTQLISEKNFHKPTKIDTIVLQINPSYPK